MNTYDSLLALINALKKKINYLTDELKRTRKELNIAKRKIKNYEPEL